MALPKTYPFAVKYLSTVHTDVSANASAWATAPGRGKIVEILVTLHAAENNSGANALTFKIGTTAITGGTITVTQAAAAGAQFSCIPTALNFVSGGDALECASDGGGGGTVPATITYVIREF